MNRLLLRNADGADPGGSWNRDPEGIQSAEGADRSQIAKTGLRLFLAVVSSLFFLFLIAFIARSQMADWLPLTEPMAPLADPWQLWLNSAFLVFSCIALQWSRMAARRARLDATVIGFVVGGVICHCLSGGATLGLAAVCRLGLLCRQQSGQQFLLPVDRPAWPPPAGRVDCLGQDRALNSWRHVPLPQLSASVELCAIYWHYLLGLWFVLFALLTSTPETYEAIARFCGLR